MSQPAATISPPAKAAPRDPQRTSRKSSTFKQTSAKVIRWLHIYVSMITCGLVLFFSVTGITLNHPTWLGASQEQLRQTSGELNREWLSPGADDKVAKLEIVEHLRRVDHARGVVSEFTVDESQCVVAFRAPGYTADAFIQRDSGKYELTESAFGVVAVLNDLHKGRDSGRSWSLVIDISAILLVVVSLTGLLLILYINRHRSAGLWTCLGGVVLSVLLYLAVVPR